LSQLTVSLDCEEKVNILCSKKTDWYTFVLFHKGLHLFLMLIKEQEKHKGFSCKTAECIIRQEIIACGKNIRLVSFSTMKLKNSKLVSEMMKTASQNNAGLLGNAVPLFKTYLLANLEVPPPLMFPVLDGTRTVALRTESRMCWLSWFLDPGGWSKIASVGLYFNFPGICTLSLLSAVQPSPTCLESSFTHSGLDFPISVINQDNPSLTGKSLGRFYGMLGQFIVFKVFVCTICGDINQDSHYVNRHLRKPKPEVAFDYAVLGCEKDTVWERIPPSPLSPMSILLMVDTEPYSLILRKKAMYYFFHCSDLGT
ncbi:hypothetical protein STEG23_033918, partial [Scotinomys teguina]